MPVDRSKIALICPKNDAEAEMIIELAKHAGIATLVSDQPHGARLALEPDLDARLAELAKPVVWIVETPGPEEEERMRARGLAVEIIDHHTYKEMDRLTDPVTGAKKPSSLQQFITLAGITDDELASWGYEPKMVRGIGIMDARYVQGLREAEYTKEEINKVLELRRHLMRETGDQFEVLLEQAKKDWDNRQERGPYIIVTSSVSGDMRGAISELSIINGEDNHPLVISVGDGEKITVQNVGLDVIDKLKREVRGNTYTFGTGRCFGVNNKLGGPKVTLEEVLHALES